MLTSFSESGQIRSTLRRHLRDNAYPGYVYGYPHKKAYRPLLEPVSLESAWAEEERRSLFCYVHLPFCHQRCSFCNLFTYVPADSPTGAYLAALEREMQACRTALGPSFRFTRLYLGGGTPTYLSCAELSSLVGSLRQTLGVDPARTQGCIEASPETVDEEKVGLLRELGFQRVSLGVQSLVPEELRQVNRRFDFQANRKALEILGRANFPHFNIDLIYGLPGQTEASWLDSLEQAIASPATSLFLYPLYVRPLTGLEKRADSLQAPTTHQMGEFYDAALERLTAAGFRQATMRQFRRDPEEKDDLEYRCQRHGMVGLGAGARSYTNRLHYSTPWKMVTRNIRAVIEEYQERMARGDFAVRYGFALDEDERQRRFVIQSLLYEGLLWSDFRLAFSKEASELFAHQWEALAEESLIILSGEGVRLSARGVRHADVVGQLFYSERVRGLMDSFEYDT